MMQHGDTGRWIACRSRDEIASQEMKQPLDFCVANVFSECVGRTKSQGTASSRDRKTHRLVVNNRMIRRTIALFGGSFDPIHLGHTSVARTAAQRIQAERTVFIPAKCSPLKSFWPYASDEDRLRMVTLATMDDDSFAVSDCELRRVTPSFTLDTVRLFRREYGEDTTIHWLLGADSIKDLVHWHRIEELLDECNLTTMQRAGCAPPAFDHLESQWGAQRVAKLTQNVVQTPLIDISSTEIRRRLAADEDVSEMLHPNVLVYIREHNLYR